MATIFDVSQQVDGTVRISVTFDGWSRGYDYSDHVGFQGFRPCGWSLSNGQDLQPPGATVDPPPGGWPVPFDWDAYLAQCGSTAVDPALLTGNEPRSAAGHQEQQPVAIAGARSAAGHQEQQVAIAAPVMAIAQPPHARGVQAAVAQETEEGWAALDRFAIRERSQRLRHGLERCDSPRLADFEVVRKLGVGSNAIVYLARCRTDGQLRAHADTLVVLKVLVHYKQDGARPSGAGGLVATSSALDRVFAAEVCSRSLPSC